MGPIDVVGIRKVTTILSTAIAYGTVPTGIDLFLIVRELLKLLVGRSLWTDLDVLLDLVLKDVM